MILRSRHHFVLALTAAAAIGCSKSKAADGAAASASASAAPAPQAAESAAKAAPAAPAQIVCTKFATTDMALTKRPPLQGTVKGARMPAGGTVEVKKPELYTVSYFQENQVETACTIRKQLESDKWTIDSMTGAGTTESPVIILAKKAADSIQVMVGPGDIAHVTKAFVTAK